MPIIELRSNLSLVLALSVKLGHYIWTIFLFEIICADSLFTLRPGMYF